VRDFAADTAVLGGDGHFRAVLHAGWEVWGPFGGYRAAIVQRAIGAATRMPRPATFACFFLTTGQPGPVDVEVTVLQAGKRAECLRARMVQDGRPILDATAWTVADGMEGFEHDVAAMPSVPGPQALKGYQELADNYAEWYPFWRNVEGRPVVWTQQTGPPVWQTWMRLRDPLPTDDPFLEAGRLLMWLDTMMWNAVPPPHGWPSPYIAPSLDLTAQFLRGEPEAEWLLCDSTAPVATSGLAACNGRVWSPNGRLLASGTSQLICRPNPMLAP
jgi:acyl-CoA thioesterase II